MVLFGMRDHKSRSERQLWLTNITNLTLEALIDRTRFHQRVDMDQEDISRSVGLMDFEGRIYRGWHHHVTLVSVAHAIRLLSRMAESDVHHFMMKRCLRHGPLAPVRGGGDDGTF
jgi:SRSO17 transposase